MIKENTIICGDCLEVMRDMPDNSVDLVVTSPPYDNLRDYKGYSFNFTGIAEQLFRLLRAGGVIVWVVGDATIDGSETGTSFRQALGFIDAGFKLHDTMIYEKNSSAFPAKRNGNRYTQIFEYMFVLCKGNIIPPNLLCDKANKWAGFTNWGNNTQYNKAGNLIQTNNKKPIPKHSPRNNIWKYTVGFNEKTGHPAVFPDQLAIDHIETWSNESDVVMDPFSGSGTTCWNALRLGRRYIGIDISPEYCNIARKRLEAEEKGITVKELQKGQGSLFAPKEME
jgi:site-specific DNA-methyltransferase (adenine-specific)